MRTTLRELRWLADLLDSKFRVPGTNIRFGLDPILSLVPGIGDLASPIFAIVLIVVGVERNVPKVVLFRMAVNALFDACIGAVPVAGNIGDVFWRANNRNLALLERHERPGTRPSTSDYLVVWGLAAVFGALVLLPVVLGVWLTIVLWRWIR